MRTASVPAGRACVITLNRVTWDSPGQPGWVKHRSHQRAIMAGMDSVTLEPAAQGMRSQRWLARLSVALAALTVVIVPVFRRVEERRPRL
jgi:hypothetical protein